MQGMRSYEAITHPPQEMSLVKILIQLKWLLKGGFPARWEREFSSGFQPAKVGIPSLQTVVLHNPIIILFFDIMMSIYLLFFPGFW